MRRTIPCSHPQLPPSRSLSRLALLLSAACLLPCATCTDRDSPAQRGAQAAGDRHTTPQAAELLDLAMRAASALPAVPHIKTRSRAQAQVVATCLGLGLPRRAERYLEEIQGWRRGIAHADLACHYIERGALAEAREHLDRAQAIAETNAAEVELQPWRRDRIRERIGRARVLLRQAQAAAQCQAGTVGTADTEDFDRQVAALDAVLATGDFDSIRPALESCVQLFDRFYADPERRTAMTHRVQRSYEKLPATIRVELLSQLADSALAHGDRPTALALVDDAQRLLEDPPWHPEHGIPARARLAALRCRAGEVAAARSEIDAALARFEAQQREIVDIHRGGVLRALAAAYHEIGDGPAARLVIGKAVAAGIVNPNSRPRAEDLVATCTLLARLGIDPDPALRARLFQIAADLGHPW